MIFDLSTLHLGDVLMAMPAMRAGDRVIAKYQHRVPGLAVDWLDDGEGLHAVPKRGQHFTDAWLAASGRQPAYHRLLIAAEERKLTVVAPLVVSAAKQWHGWLALGRYLRDAAWVGTTESRSAWMALLARAHTVICPDTGTAHMADALGCPRVVALHGAPANWLKCAPYWNRAHCVVRDCMDAITVDDVMEVVRG